VSLIRQQDWISQVRHAMPAPERKQPSVRTGYAKNANEYLTMYVVFDASDGPSNGTKNAMDVITIHRTGHQSRRHDVYLIIFVDKCHVIASDYIFS
jgi:hypothetical protein